MTMRKQIIVIAIFLANLMGMISCQNQDWDFPDYDYTSLYFPYQYPIRTLVLGDYYFDNSNDNELKFIISATMGGVYENGKDRYLDFVVDESLTDSVYLGDVKILPLPQEYYTLSNSQIVIPKGKLAGGVEVQLAPSFLNDSNSIGFEGTVYVVPLRIISSTDSVIVGVSGVENPNRLITTDWKVQPKDFTLFGINYVNDYHGNYLLRGVSDIYLGDEYVETAVYRQKDVEKDQVVEINTSSRNSVIFANKVSVESGASPGDFEMLITFNDNGNGSIKETVNSPFPVSGSAQFVKNSESWGGEDRHAIYLDYQINDGTYTHNAKDTLVFRDKGIKFQEFVPTIKE